jgi:hypothetical protein
MTDGSSSGGVLAGDRPAAGLVRHSRHATWALWLGGLGFGLGFLLLFAVLTPAAIVFGVRGLREIHADPQLRGRGRAWAGMALAVVAPLVWIGVFVAFLVDGIG